MLRNETNDLSLTQFRMRGGEGGGWGAKSIRMSPQLSDF